MVELKVGRFFLGNQASHRMTLQVVISMQRDFDHHGLRHAGIA